MSHETVVTIRHEATDRKVGLSLNDLRNFVEDAYDKGATGLERVRATTGFRSQLQALEVKMEE